MKVLFIVGSCLYMNTSANMSHNAYIKGLIENGYDVDVLMPDNSFGEKDNILKNIEGANYYIFPYYSNLTLKIFSLKDKIRKGSSAKTVSQVSSANDGSEVSKPGLKAKIKSIVKKIYNKLINNDDIYWQMYYWMNNTFKNYNLSDEYDLVISNSSPAAGHKLAMMLRDSKKVKSDRWIQIWEDPWAYDLYGNAQTKIIEEEHSILKSADEIVYVSPLTLLYQQKYYSDCADKMRCVPLPFFEYEVTDEKQNVATEISYGYFGDYYSKTRNLVPFYNAVKQTDTKAYIYGDTDLSLESTDKIDISPRVTLDVLSQVQAKAEVLVHLCNLKGGQIPGKIYHYSATKKPILFILDGTYEERECIKEFFEPYGRYIMCNNDKDSIINAIKEINSNPKEYEKIDEFCPKNIVNQIISGKRACDIAIYTSL